MIIRKVLIFGKTYIFCRVGYVRKNESKIFLRFGSSAYDSVYERD